jgi:hypothetical protein
MTPKASSTAKDSIKSKFNPEENITPLSFDGVSIEKQYVFCDFESTIEYPLCHSFCAKFRFDKTKIYESKSHVLVLVSLAVALTAIGLSKTRKGAAPSGCQSRYYFCHVDGHDCARFVFIFHGCVYFKMPLTWYVADAQFFSLQAFSKTRKGAAPSGCFARSR